jgi:hypothetical protein
MLDREIALRAAWPLGLVLLVVVFILILYKDIDPKVQTKQENGNDGRQEIKAVNIDNPIPDKKSLNNNTNQDNP